MPYILAKKKAQNSVHRLKEKKNRNMQTLSIEKFLQFGENIPTLDVRTPAEYEHGHIPNAVNMPLFSNEERAEIGTLYKQSGKQQAILQGLELVGPRLKQMADFAMEQISQKNKNTENKILLHCWRGGMRSSSVAWLLEQVGITCYTLEKGYKNYRNFVLQTINAPLKLKVLSGKTGSGKTQILKQLTSLSEQVIDLENLAHHKGSAFGALGQEPQPTQEQFENNLANDILRLNREKPIWVEDESHMIGKICLPQNFWQQKLNAPLYFLEADVEQRLQHLMNEYGNFSTDDLLNALEKISKRLGGERTKQAIKAITENDKKEAMRIVLDYYDRTYMHSLSKRKTDEIKKIVFENIIQSANALKNFG